MGLIINAWKLLREFFDARQRFNRAFVVLLGSFMAEDIISWGAPGHRGVQYLNCYLSDRGGHKSASSLCRLNFVKSRSLFHSWRRDGKALSEFPSH